MTTTKPGYQLVCPHDGSDLYINHDRIQCMGGDHAWDENGNEAMA